ncbi:MAG TPA: M23 family metallopeptidase [Acidimicrobiales bacterium]
MTHRIRLAAVLAGAVLAMAAATHDVPPPGRSSDEVSTDEASTADIAPDRPADEIPAGSAAADEIRLIRFPIGGDTAVSYEDTFGACRGTNCSRRHMGTDIFAPKLTPLVAAQAGRITWLRSDASGTAGNGVGITDAEGWRYLYLHLNNDTPGTDDGANPPEWRFAPGIALDAYVEAGDLLGYVGDSGNAETTPPHVHFELRRPDGVTINAYPSLRYAERYR